MIMRNEISLHIPQQKIEKLEANTIMFELNNQLEIDGISIKTGIEYDFYVLEDGFDSSSYFTTVIFYVEGSTKFCYETVASAVDIIVKIIHVKKINSIYYNSTDINRILTYSFDES